MGPDLLQQCHNFFSRKSIVGTTIHKDTPIPKDLVGDEYHTKLGGQKIYLATTVSKGCFLGVGPSQTCDEQGLTKAYGIFKKKLRHWTQDMNPIVSTLMVGMPAILHGSHCSPVSQ